MSKLNILMAQINTFVGDFDGNTEKVLNAVAQAQREHTRPVVVCPELTLSGYPPEDLLLRPSIELRVNQSLAVLCSAIKGEAYVVVGYPKVVDGNLYNVVGVIHAGEVIAEYRKQALPNYQVFDEKRYFRAGDQPCIFTIDGTRIGLSICEDIWEEGPTLQAAAAGAQLLININSSPYHRGKPDERLAQVGQRARQAGIPIVYVNQVGGQDELVFDGGSFAVNADGGQVAAAPCYVEGTYWLHGECDGEAPVQLSRAEITPPMNEYEATWQALVLGVRDYVNKNRFPGSCVGAVRRR